MRQSPVIETVRHAFPINTLLTKARNHLRNVQHGTLGAGFDDFHETIALIETFHADFAGLTRGVVQNVAHLNLELLRVGFARIVFQDTQVQTIGEFRDLGHLGGNHLENTLGGFAIRHQVTHAYTVCRGFHVLGNHLLQVVDVVGTSHVSEIVANAIQDALGTRGENALVRLPSDVLAIVDFKNIVGNGCVFCVFKELRLVLERNGRRDLRQDVEVGDSLFVAEFLHVDVGVAEQNVHRLSWREIDALFRKEI